MAGDQSGRILEDGPLLIVGRQVPTGLGRSIDLLGIDREGHVVVVELKRDRTPRDVVAQALEYAAFAARLDVDELESIFDEYPRDSPELNLAFSHREYFDRLRPWRSTRTSGSLSGCMSGWDYTVDTTKSGCRRPRGKHSRPDRPHNP